MQQVKHLKATTSKEGSMFAGDYSKDNETAHQFLSVHSSSIDAVNAKMKHDSTRQIEL